MNDHVPFYSAAIEQRRREGGEERRREREREREGDGDGKTQSVL